MILRTNNATAGPVISCAIAALLLAVLCFVCGKSSSAVSMNLAMIFGLARGAVVDILASDAERRVLCIY
jgi:hypothetical protein